MNRVHAVYVRKSSTPQEEASQIDALKSYLDRQHVHVARDHWFGDTGSRAKPEERPDFQRLMRLVEKGKISHVYIWKQDRFVVGTKLWFKILWEFEQTQTQLIDILTGKDLAADDVATELTTALSARSGKEDLVIRAENVMRARGSLALGGTPLSKWPPYGFDKKISDAAGKHLWTVHLLDNGKWLVTNPDGSSVERERCPRKSKSDTIQYIPTRDKARIALVRSIFKTYATEAISETKIAIRLNAAGHLHYSKPWIRTSVQDLLVNPAYIGHVRNMNTSQAEYATHDGTQVVRLTRPEKTATGGVKTRKGACVVVENRHEPLVDKATWDRVQEKQRTKSRRTQPPRRDELWLRGVLVCGQCRQPMHIFTCPAKNKFGYICSSYYYFAQTHAERFNTGCPRSWISHEAAVELVKTKLGAMLDSTTVEGDDELSRLREHCQLGEAQLKTVLLQSLTDYMLHVCAITKDAGRRPEFDKLLAKVLELDRRGVKDADDDELRNFLNARLPSPDVALYRKFFLAFEELRVEGARAKLDALNAEYDRWLAAKVGASSDRERERHSAKLRDLETELAKWEQLAIPLDVQLAEVRSRLAGHRQQLADTVRSLSGSQNLRKAELVRSFFREVVLHFRVVQKKVYRDCVFEPEKTEFVSNLAECSTYLGHSKITLMLLVLLAD